MDTLTQLGKTFEQLDLPVDQVRDFPTNSTDLTYRLNQLYGKSIVGVSISCTSEKACKRIVMHFPSTAYFRDKNL